MVAASSANAASGTLSGGGSAAPSVSSAPPARNDGHSSSDESEEEEVEWQSPGSKEVSPNSEAQDRAPSPSPKLSGPVSDNPPPDTEVGETTGPQVISVNRANALQTLGLLPSGQGSSSDMPVVVEIPPGEPSDLTVRVVGVPATENHNDGGTFLQDGFCGLEALVQMESLGATELVVLYDFFDDNDIIGDFILTSRETPLTATELPSQLKNFTVKRELTSILSQFDSKQLTLRTFGTVSLLQKVARKYDRIKRKLAEDDGAASVIGLQNEVLRLQRDQQFQSSYWIEKVAEVQRERNAAVAQMRSYFVVLMEERERDVSSLLPPEWQTVIPVMANDNLAFQAPPFVRMDPPQDEDDEETKESDPPAPDSFLDLSRGASTTKFRSKSVQLGKRAYGSQSPKSNKKQAPDGVQELPSEWVGSTSPCLPEELVMEDRLEYPAALALAGEDKCLHSSFPLVDLTIMLLSMMHWHRLDSAPWKKYVPRRYFTVASVALEAEKDEDYNLYHDEDDGVDDEGEIPDDASDDGVLNVAQRTTKRRRLSQSSAGVSAPKKIKTKSPVKSKIKVGSSGKSKSGSGSSKKPRSKSGGSRRRNESTATVLAVKGPQYLDAEECRVIESPGLGITSWIYVGVRMKPGDPTAHAPFQTQGFPDFVLIRRDLDILKERCDGEELKAFLVTRPWTKLYDTRRTEFFFHRRADLGPEVVRALEDWVDFMEENVEALCHATHWVVLGHDSTSKFILKTSVRRLKLYESVRKKVIAREKQLKKVAPASVWSEPDSGSSLSASATGYR
ncbi:unnamed protein product [Phytophthora fragariaefolia]|uniref:Unnamed protein product n=1 Tax=Phytophthora fragariaefolia TaxID=1490495 RepID=A0A9W6Y8N9_9STRA|nr:unnamed protein product [Phytophthora fragariaefolia]